ncbi:MAG: glutathione S-transferase [Phenylobacterium sp.]|nr:glutathione S-transferase [Phenylobacterium sp.]
MAAEIILHHYDTSPFSEKPRVMFGIKGLAWRSVIQPVIMPKPELVPLTGGYRRIPVMQIGADLYCDTQVILAEIEARAPEPRLVRGADWAVNIWADRLFFQATVAVVFGAIGDHVPKDFIADREKLSGRPFDMAAMKAAAIPMKAHWRAHAGWIEDGLAAADFLGGSTPSLADISAYMNVWWLSAAVRTEADELLARFPRVGAWRGRMRAIGHGQRSEMTGAEALEVARDSQPAPGPAHDLADPLGLSPGELVSVSADDYGRDAIAGRLVALTPERVIIARETEDLGRLHVHFPRIGYLIARV